MVERLIYALIYLCGLALCFYLIVWVLGAIGIVLPQLGRQLFSRLLALFMR